MQQFLQYSVKVAAVLAVFYMFYRLLLSRESLHRLNRVVLLAIAVLSFVLPAGLVTVHKTVTMAPETTNEAVIALDIVEEAVGYSTAEVVAGAPATIDTAPANWRRSLLAAALALYLLGAAFVLWKLLASLYGIRRVIRNGRRLPQDDGTVIVVTDEGATPSSWMHYIFLSPEDAESPEPAIIRHERAHIALRHSWDLLLVDIVKSVQWFNPAIWMLRRDLSVVHEYEADKAVLDAGADARAYQLLLVRKAMTESGYTLANGFSFSTLRGRIRMMQNRPSGARGAWKLLAFLPLTAVTLVLTAHTRTDYLADTKKPLDEAVVLNDTYKPRAKFGSINDFQEFWDKGGIWRSDTLNIARLVSEGAVFAISDGSKYVRKRSTGERLFVSEPVPVEEFSRLLSMKRHPVLVSDEGNGVRRYTLFKDKLPTVVVER